ncbi:hypothetical protein Tco_1400034 [Tanacetum coccineum]
MNVPSSYYPSTPKDCRFCQLRKGYGFIKIFSSCFVKGGCEIYVTCGGPHPYHQYLVTNGNVFLEYRDIFKQTQVAPSNELSNYKKIIDTNIKAMQNQINNVKNELRNEMQTSIQTSMSNQTNELKNMMASFFQMNTASSSGSGPLPSNTIANPRGDLKAITTRSGISYDGPPIPPLPKVVEREPEVTKDTVQPSTKNIQPPVVQIQAPIDEPVVAPKPKLTARALIDVYGEELTLRVDDEAITFKVGQTSRYSYNDVVSINRIDVIDVACEEYAQEVLGFSDSSTSGNPTPSLDPILSTSSPSLIHFKEELHVEELKIVKSSIDDPPELELKDLPSHLEYAFLEGTDKLPVIIAKNLKEDEKVRLLKVLKSHKRAIAWKISDIKGIDPQFCTHKILMEDDSKLAIQHQRRVNPKIHEVIKKEVIKLLDAGLIYPISDSPWVSPVHCVPKKGGITVIENEDPEC